MRLVDLSLLCGVMLAPIPGIAMAAITVQDYQQSFAALKQIEAVPETMRAAYVEAHKAELDHATQIQERAAMAYQTLLEANEESFDHYGRSLLCNFSEEDPQVSFKDFVDEYVAELRDIKKLPEPELLQRVRYTDFTQLLVDKMMTRFECPIDFPSGPAAAATFIVPPAPPTIP